MCKDHKEPDRETGDPATRPVCGASRSINGELGETISEIYSAAAQLVENTEVCSTEDLLGRIDRLNQSLKTEEPPETGYYLGSIDAVSLYPRLDIPQCTKLATNKVVASCLKMVGVNWKWVTILVALGMTQEEINRENLAHLIPRRRSSRGKRPTILTASLEEKRQRWRWERSPASYTEEEKGILLAKLLELSANTVFQHHYYKWQGKIYRQVRGGGIGLRATQALA